MRTLRASVKFSEGEDGADVAERAVAASVLEIEAYGRNVESYFRGPGFFRGQRRFVPNGSPMSLYWEYVAFAQGRSESPASFTTFLRVFRRIWKDKLIFRTSSQHAQCDTCSGLKKDIKSARSDSERHGFLQRYVGHVRNQWQDRMIYWSLCILSTTWATQALAQGARLQWGSVAASCIALIIDGIDQAKFRIPRLDTMGPLLRDAVCGVANTFLLVHRRTPFLQWSSTTDAIILYIANTCWALFYIKQPGV